MVSALDSRASGLGSSPGRGHSVVFLGKTLYSHSASLHPGVRMVPANCWENLTNCGGVTCDGLAAASCYRKRIWASDCSRNLSLRSKGSGKPESCCSPHR